MNRRTRFALIAVVGNLLSWSLFLLRTPLPPELFAAKDRARREIATSHPGLEPYIIASRSVARGWPHGNDTPVVESYQFVSFPGILLGGGIGWAVEEALSFNSGVAERASWYWESSENRSWVVAGVLAAGTTVWWAIIGMAIERISRRKTIAGPDNNALEPARSTQTAVGPRGSMRCCAGLWDWR